RGFFKHSGFFGVAWHTFISDSPYSTVFYDIIHLVLEDLGPQITSFLGPVAFLDDSAVHVHNIHGAVRCCRNIRGAKERISRLDEFRFSVNIGVLNISETFFLLGGYLSDDPSHWFSIEIFTHQFLG